MVAPESFSCWVLLASQPFVLKLMAPCGPEEEGVADLDGGWDFRLGYELREMAKWLQ
ncbi:MAG: hypothetical protein MK108_05825 [Mariniblastus sp.]|nr:hypothetical protein [Mariniblastus sp.]